MDNVPAPFMVLVLIALMLWPLFTTVAVMDYAKNRKHYRPLRPFRR